MAKLPQVSGHEAIKAFEKDGFHLHHITGSHHVLKKAGHLLSLSVPLHKSLKPGTLRSLIRAANLTGPEKQKIMADQSQHQPNGTS